MIKKLKLIVIIWTIILMEESAECKDDYHYYSYQYITGSTEEIIGNVAFYGNHADSKEVRELQNKQYKAVLELEREYYQKKINIKGDNNERLKENI
ncbi:hypothetical protein [Bacillus smithii]|uniref:hypothetical protein n=1 Tax=Bacillus smithii TaxID=1479 RepID=UPI003D1DBF1C